MYSVLEGDSVTVTVELTGETATEVMVNIATQDGTAMGELMHVHCGVQNYIVDLHAHLKKLHAAYYACVMLLLTY